ncbi:MAG TPA: rRNA pseudouridine synthase [Nitrospirae bacterium]|nr:rRNA pseudouridine synthase [Nitrospirota bacterium]
MEERIQKILAKAGIASRRKAEELILEGRVLVNGQVATLGMKADMEKDYIKVDGKLVIKPEPKTYAMLNKPKGFLTTLEDPQGRPTIKELIKGIRYRVYPVGRLDFNSEGLLILTNDGELAYRLIHPSYKVPKTYLVKVKGIVEEKDLNKLRKGIMLEDGMTAPARIRRIRMPKTERNSWLEITIHEGKKRQIRRMFQRIRHPVLKLKRIRIDGISLGNLPPGQWRYLSPEEIQKLRKSVKI